MYGGHVFSVHVTLASLSGPSTRQMIFKRSGSASKTATHWLYAQVNIKAPPHLKSGRISNITIEGIRGISYDADIAFDDISFGPGKCPEFMPRDATPPPPTIQTTTAPLPKTTRQTTSSTTSNPMQTREWNPFYQMRMERCEITSTSGQTQVENYIINSYVCCGNKISSRKNGSKCCDGIQYFARKQACCGGEVIRKSEFDCCNGVKIEKDQNQLCCAGEYRPFDDELGCCNDKTFFNRTKNGCCSNTLYDRQTHYCCGGTYNGL